MKIDVTKIATLFTNLSPIVTSRVVSGVNPPFFLDAFFSYIWHSGTGLQGYLKVVRTVVTTLLNNLFLQYISFIGLFLLV